MDDRCVVLSITGLLTVLIAGCYLHTERVIDDEGVETSDGGQEDGEPSTLDEPTGDGPSSEVSETDPELECPLGIEIPTPEVLGDSVDNDCDGEVDECDASDGCYSDEVCWCIPGAYRTCDTPDYSNWGEQRCGDDGRWGPCHESSPIPARARFGWYSPEAEACCILEEHCCQDMWDLDRDGDTWESLGDCTDVIDCEY